MPSKGNNPSSARQCAQAGLRCSERDQKADNFLGGNTQQKLAVNATPLAYRCVTLAKPLLGDKYLHEGKYMLIFAV